MLGKVDQNMKDKKFLRQLSIVTFFICILILTVGFFYVPAKDNENSNKVSNELEEKQQAEVLSHNDIVFPPLIQATTHKSEYNGLLHLGMLEQTSNEILNADDIPAIEEVVSWCIPTSVSIKAGNYMGCGSIIYMSEEEIILVSCKHLLQYGYDIEVTFFDDTQVFGVVTYLSDQYDVAFAKIKTDQIPPSTLVDLRYLHVDKDRVSTLKEGDGMFLIGFEAGGYLTRIGKVVNPSEYFVEFNSFMMRNQCAGEAGMSGGGTFDVNGNYLGLLVGGILEDTATLPYEIIMEEYQHMISSDI